MTGTPRRVYVKTLGCQMNVHDTGKMLALLALDGFAPTDEPREADLVLVNTCAVREKPEHKLRSFLGTLKRRAGGGPRPLVGIAGCVPAHDGPGLFRRYPDVDIIFSPDAIHRVRELVREAAARRVLEHHLVEGERWPFVPDLAPDAGQHPTGLVTIQKGCDNHCTYCIVPFTRGRETSRASIEVVDEVRRLVEAGVRDVTLLGQNVNSYGRKREGELDFPGLLRAVHAVPGLLRLRFTTSHPRDLSPGLVEAFRDLPRLANHLHLPVQSGSDRVLRRMGRGMTRQDYLDRVAALREARPDISLTTDFIVGFPGETEADFEGTLSLLEEVRFDASFSFCYSPRPRTAAVKLHDREAIPRGVAAERLAILQSRQDAIAAENNGALVGRTMEVLVEGRSRQDGAVLAGRTSCFRTVNLPGTPDLVGRLVPVRITGATVHALVGERAEG